MEKLQTRPKRAATHPAATHAAAAMSGTAVWLAALSAAALPAALVMSARHRLLTGRPGNVKVTVDLTK